MRRQTTDWEKIFANDVPDKGLFSKIYKELLNLTLTHIHILYILKKYLIKYGKPLKRKAV